MKKFLIFLLCIIILPSACFAGVGDIDNRYYVTDEMWATEPYKNFVLLTTTTYVYKEIRDYKEDDEGNIVETKEMKKIPQFGTCTGQYISRNLILSAGHCTDKSDDVVYNIRNYNGEESEIKLIETPYNGNVRDMGDWAVWLITNPKLYNDSHFDIKIPKKTTDVINAGFGWCRIIYDEELNIIRKIIEDFANGGTNFISINKLRYYIGEELEKQGIPDINEKFPYALKASSCKIVFKDCKQIVDLALKDVNALNKSHDEKEKKKLTKKLTRQENKFKKVCNNQYLYRDDLYPDVLATTCDSWGGNSGGGYISENGKNLYGTSSNGADAFEDFNNSDYIVSSKQFDKRINELIKIYDSKNSVEENIAKIPNRNKPVVDSNSINLQQEVNNMEENLANNLSNVSSMSDEQLLTYLNKLVEYQVRYEQLKAKEQSKANRMLTAATIAASGIGGMELAQGLAEQKADKDAEQAMDAYIATMRCKYGNGKQVKAGLNEIELPGGNDETMMKLKSEYFALATDLKERKEALGMKPGIESETILDKSQMGLYDDESVGITSGNYSSLYRAKMLNSETDQTQIDEAKETSKNRVVGGGTAAGIGVVGGAVGDYLINEKSSKQKDKK